LAATNPRVQDKPLSGKKKRWDAILVGIGMTIAFIIVLMRLTGYFPCDIVNTLQPSTDLNCGDSVESNFAAFFEWSKNSIVSYLP
jgi:hypothetical protein